MTDWSDEVKARLWQEAYECHCTSPDDCCQDCADIRAALSEIDRRGIDAVRVAEAVNAQLASLQDSFTRATQRAEAAEAERDRYNRMCGALEANLAEMTDAYLEDHAKVGNRDSALDALRTKLAEAQMELSDARHSLAHCVPGRQAALAEVERLRKALEDERSGKAKAERARNAEASALRGGGE